MIRRIDKWLTDPDAKFRLPIFTFVILLLVPASMALAQMAEVQSDVQGQKTMWDRIYSELTRFEVWRNEIAAWLATHFKS